MEKFLAGAIVLTFLVLYIKNNIRNKKLQKLKEQQEQEEKQRLQNYFKTILPQVKNANSEFHKLKDIKGSYFSHYQLCQWKIEHRDILENKFESMRYSDIGLTNSEKKELDMLIGIKKNSEQLRQSSNNYFVGYEMGANDELLSNIDGGKSLDEQQREAIIRDEDNSLVVAGAGCGKTTTILGKIQYLCKRLQVKPTEILLISFTKKSAEDLANKLNINGLEPKTFHKLGLDIITQVEKGRPSTFDQSSHLFLKSKFKELVNDERYLGLVVSYFTDYVRVNKNEFDFENQAEYIQHLKDQNFRPYKQVQVQVKNRQTLQREIVKSQEECKLANFLLFNRINYKYEEPYEIRTRSLDYRQYAPDFSLYQNGRRIYLEHYGIDRMGNVPPFFANERTTLEEAKAKYNEAIAWKRDLHNNNGTTCLETFSYEFHENCVFNNLKTSLEGQGFVVNPMNEQEKWRLINESASDEIDSLISLFNTFLNLFKSNNFTKEELQNRITKKTGYEKERSTFFVKLFYPLFDSYQSMLKRKEQIDFSDMINKATYYVESGRFNSNYKYIIIDEFQDISIGRYKLLKSFQNQDDSLKIFAVGDDWQSIYRFTGSDISLFTNFETYFGYTQTSFIETTYRFGYPMINVSGDFVMKNPSQLEKQLESNLDIQSEIEIFYSDNFENDDTDALQEAIDRIIKISMLQVIKGKSIQEIRDELKSKKYYLLGRYNFDFKRIKVKDSKFDLISDTKIKYVFDDELSIELDFLTVHRSKGMEADFVFVLNCNSGKVGFPSEMIDDPVLLMLLGDSESYPNSEERRLFYVALTRAKRKTSLIANKKFASKFILELEERNTEVSDKCPRCKTGDLILKSGYSAKTENKWGFYGCSNFALYNCQYKSDFLSIEELEEALDKPLGE